MKLILITSPHGSRMVRPNERYVLQPDEIVKGLADDGKIGLGDVVAKVTKFFGARPCSRCNRDRIRLNKYRVPRLF